MTHELKHIIEKALEFQQNGLKSILATVVALDGSSYRKPGVRMLITEDGQMIGAVSGGCVERDIAEQARSVFQDGVPKVMTYDGRYRLGCEGVLYILIEPLVITEPFIAAFAACLQARQPMQVTSCFRRKEGTSAGYGTVISFNEGSTLSLRKDYSPAADPALQSFKQSLAPCFQLYIFGGEHDSVKLCSMASALGWEVQVVTSVRDPKTLADFPGASSVTAEAPELVQPMIDKDTAVVLMTHNYAQDLKFLLKIAPFHPRYIGILGSKKRQEKLVDDIFTHQPDFNFELVEHIYSPAGLHIGSVTPEEIALSILAEILAVYRGMAPNSLRDIQKQTLTK